ncbi:putative bifunctional diguanylate cyclase/phosphodiesterase [Pengzhenrongella sicca]|uniref:EAL domain-containing protein n=1 Tax=Pengzhenrongella sicca TaxID=2819238 RepID=A0A8A4Z914_9MICO|nr:EAL domain-containing protein [Pengzhenrongella sicca]QTE27911.1 EAL domain-containing protein [Pengzhenrongella sicca]
MSPSARTAGEPFAGPSARRNAVSTAMIVVVLVALAVAGAAYFTRAGAESTRTERSLGTLATELRVQDAIRWRADGGRTTVEVVEADLAASRARAEDAISVARAGTLGEQAASALRAAHDAYAAAVDVEMDRLADGQAAEALAQGQVTVEPALQSALALVGSAERAVVDAAARAKVASDLAALSALVLAVAAAALQGRRRLGETRAEQADRSERRFRALVDQSADIVVVIDHAGATHYLSPSAERRLGGDGPGPDDRLDLFSGAHPDDRAPLRAALASVRPGAQAVVLEVRLPARPTDAGDDGAWRTFELTIQDPGDDAGIGGLVLTGHDVTEPRRLQRELEHRALHDSLTGLPNRALLGDRFDQALLSASRAGTAVGLLLIDLDRFKEINDTLGHHYGDQLLVQVGTRFESALRASDTIARLGGDEFAVLLADVGGLDAAMEVAHTLQATLTSSFVVDGIELDVEASIGVVVSGEHGADVTTLMQRADIAMYVAKQRNLRVSAYDPGGDEHSPTRLALLGDLRRALRGDELVLHYQPKVSLSTGEVCGAEALVRWQHPERGLIPPSEFIPLAENTGLIGPLTRHVLNLALLQQRRWIDNGSPLKLAVNLSARNLLDERLDVMVAELLAEHGVPARWLTLEVTESAIMTDPKRARELLERIAEQGIEIAIDDFGAGYTSLGQLKHLPVTELKIDLSYVTTMDTDTSNSLIVRSVIELGHNLGLSAVAEGVESAAILTGLTSFTCDVAQGYHLSRPLPVDAFDRWCASWPGLVALTGVEIPQPRPF